MRPPEGYFFLKSIPKEVFGLHPNEYRDNVEMGENTVQEVMLDLQSGNIHYYVSYLRDIVDEECDLSVRADVLMENVLEK